MPWGLGPTWTLGSLGGVSPVSPWVDLSPGRCALHILCEAASGGSGPKTWGHCMGTGPS